MFKIGVVVFKQIDRLFMRVPVWFNVPPIKSFNFRFLQYKHYIHLYNNFILFAVNILFWIYIYKLVTCPLNSNGQRGGLFYVIVTDRLHQIYIYCATFILLFMLFVFIRKIKNKTDYKFYFSEKSIVKCL